MRPHVIAVVGATASGKSEMALCAAEKLGAEIICMDSMQVYRGMDIGTAKPSAADCARVRHHMLSVADPREGFTVSRYAEMAAACVDDIVSRGKTPMLVGGTGLYLRALSGGMTMGGVAGDEALREELHRCAEREGNRALHARLAACDPESAARLHPNDVRRVVRALEVYMLTGEPLSCQKPPAESDAPYRFSVYAPDLPRDTLYRRIDARVEAMLSTGLLDEVRALLRSGVPESAQAMQGLGYKEVLPVLAGRCTMEEAALQIKINTRRYAKRQLTWFRADARVVWLMGDAQACATQVIQYEMEGLNNDGHSEIDQLR